MNLTERKKLASVLLAVAKELAIVENNVTVASEVTDKELMGLKREVRAMIAAEPRIEIDVLPSMSRSQIKSWIDFIVKARQELEKARIKYESILNMMSKLEADEKKGLAALKEAAVQMKEKGRYLIELENALLEFTAYTDTKRPGVIQMLGDPDEAPVGAKAGELLQRVAAKLGDEIAKEVGLIYRECMEDLTHSSDAVKLMKVIDKTASVSDERLKKAGLADVVISIKEWLAGGTDAIVKRILNFAGDIKRWVKGFVERTNLVKKSTDKVTTNLDKVKSLIDDYIKAQEA